MISQQFSTTYVDSNLKVGSYPIMREVGDGMAFFKSLLLYLFSSSVTGMR
jgi:hypothetical protein